MTSEPQQIRLRQNTSRRIIAGKISRARELLIDGHSVRFQLQYRNSETKNVEQRLRLFGKVTLALQDVSVVETDPVADSERSISMVLRPF